MPRTTADIDRFPASRARRAERSVAAGRRILRYPVAGLLLLAICTVATIASADVKFEGDWPDNEKTISLSVDGKPRSAAIRQLAQQAGWSLILESSAPEEVTLLVKDQAADEVLEALLREGSWVAQRQGALVSLRRAPSQSPRAASSASSAPPASSSSAQPPATRPSPQPKTGKDRFVTGNSATIDADEIVRDLVVMGGSAEVFGTVTGDMVVFGGTATIHPGGRVMGDSAVFGGSLEIEEGGDVEGDEVAFGGTVRKNGETVTSGLPFGPPGRPKTGWTGPSIAARLAHELVHSALLFLFGAFLLAVAAPRVESLRIAFVARPLASLFRGLLATVVVGLATLLLAVTCIGIPFAAALAVATVLAASAGLCAILATAGAALVQHRSQNPYVHLGVGCALFFVVGLVPFAGSLASFLLGAMGLGVFVATRGAGLWPRPAASGPAAAS